MNPSKTQINKLKDYIHKSDCYGAIASIMGQNPVGISRSKSLIKEVINLDLKSKEVLQD